LLGREACQCERTPEESYQKMADFIACLLPNATDKQIKKILK